MRIFLESADRILPNDEIVMRLYGEFTAEREVSFKGLLHRLRVNRPDLEIEHVSGYRLRRQRMRRRRGSAGGLDDDHLSRLLLALARGHVTVIDVQPDGTSTLRIHLKLPLRLDGESTSQGRAEQPSP